MRLIQWLAKRRFPYQPLISISISRSHLLGNIAILRRLAPGKSIAPVLKSNAYGHGLCEIANIIERDGGPVSFFAVDSYFEAVALRARRIKTPLVVIGYTSPENISISYLARTSFTITSIEALRAICRDGHIPRSHTISIHLKIDTGMHRQGILPTELPEALELIRQNRSIKLDGALTHFADADSVDRTSVDRQISLWNKLTKDIRTAFPDIRYLHASNTDGIAYAKDIDCNTIRIGIGLYGLSDNSLLSGENFEPVLEMKTVISGTKKLAPGEAVGYGSTFQATTNMTIATIPVGYYEGVDRRLSSNQDGEARGYILVGPERKACPIIGRVSMNITTIDISGVPEAKNGTDVVVISRIATEPNTLVKIAKACGTIAYEMAVKIPGHIRRTVSE